MGPLTPILVFRLGFDSSDRIRRQLVTDLLTRLCDDLTWAQLPDSESEMKERMRVHLRSLEIEKAITVALGSETTSLLRSRGPACGK